MFHRKEFAIFQMKSRGQTRGQSAVTGRFPRGAPATTDLRTTVIAEERLPA